MLASVKQSRNACAFHLQPFFLSGRGCSSFHSLTRGTALPPRHDEPPPCEQSWRRATAALCMLVGVSAVHFAYSVVRDIALLVRRSVVQHSDCPPCQCLISGPSGCESLERVLAESLRLPAASSYTVELSTVAAACCVCFAAGVAAGYFCRSSDELPRSGSPSRRGGLGVLKDGAR